MSGSSLSACPLCHFPGQSLWEKNGCQVERCSSCGVGWASNEGFDPKSYYTADYFDGGHGDGYADYVGSENVLREEFRSIVNEMLRVVPPKAKILEVGAAYGFFMLEARQHFEILGVEIADDAAAFARARGLDVRTGVVTTDLLQELGPFDAVVMLDVIEHLEDPTSTLRLLTEHLRPGGVIIVTTGDFGSVFAKVTGKAWRLMTPPQHLWFFSRKSIAALAHAAGLTMQSFTHPWKWVPLSLVLYQLGRLAGVHLSPKSIGWASRLGLPINLFDAMRVTLRKSPAQA